MPKRKMHGSGALSDIKDFIVQNKLISKGLGYIPHPAGQVASSVASMLGLGRRKRRAPRRRVQGGRGIFSDFGGGIGNIFGGLGGGVGSIAHGLFGSGARRRKPRRRLML